MSSVPEQDFAKMRDCKQGASLVMSRRVSSEFDTRSPVRICKQRPMCGVMKCDSDRILLQSRHCRRIEQWCGNFEQSVCS